MLGHFAAHLGAGHHSPGVFLVALPCSIPEILEALFYYADVSDEGLWRDRILFFSLFLELSAYPVTSAVGSSSKLPRSNDEVVRASSRDRR
jgi:hypothetical protein